MEIKKLQTIDKIYVSHYAPLTDRRAYLTPILKQLSDNVEWVTNYDRNNVTEEDLSFYEADLDKWIKRTSNMYHGWMDGQPQDFRTLSMGEICNGLNHISILKKMISDKVDKAIIFEDDVLINPNHNGRIDLFDDMFRQTPQDFDMIFFGNNYPWRAFQSLRNMPKPNGLNVIKVVPPNSRTADAFVITQKAAQQLVDIVPSLVLPWDMEMNHWLNILNFNVYHWWDGLVAQGTFTGHYQTKGGLEN